jgi:hypothetical protein
MMDNFGHHLASSRRDRIAFLLHPGEPSTFILRQVEGDGDSGLLEARLVGTELLTQTLEFWRRWVSKCRYDGRWREMVNRSALMLKLLTFEPTGAIVAAPTCSLPEEIGGVRNWDYRYTWLRDAAFTLYAFLRLGMTSEAEHFMGWLEQKPEHSQESADRKRVLQQLTLHGVDPPISADPPGAGFCAHGTWDRWDNPQAPGRSGHPLRRWLAGAIALMLAEESLIAQRLGKLGRKKTAA